MNNPLAGTEPSGYVAECAEEGGSCEETVTPEVGDRILEDKDGNRYLDQGGDTVSRIEKVSATKNGVTGSVNVSTGMMTISAIGAPAEHAGPVSSNPNERAGSGDANYFIESDRRALDSALETVNTAREQLTPFGTELEAVTWLNENAGDLQDKYGAEVGAIIAKVYGERTGFRIGVIVTSYHSNYVSLSTSVIKLGKMEFLDSSIKNMAHWHTHTSGSFYSSWGIYRDSHTSVYRDYVSSVGINGRANLSLYDAPAIRATQLPITIETFRQATSCLIGDCR